MLTVNIDEAKTQLSRLIDQAVKGESFIIAKAGKPLVKVTALDAAGRATITRLGVMAGQITVPDDFNQMGDGEIQRMFGIDALSCCSTPASCSSPQAQT